MNIIFLGMPMSGKTTIGKIVAEKLHFTFSDTDELIGEKNNISIGKIIEQSVDNHQGEDYLHPDLKDSIKHKRYKLKPNIKIEDLQKLGYDKKKFRLNVLTYDQVNEINDYKNKKNIVGINFTNVSNKD